ncbi:MAG: pirin family protein [Deltaproteobacteria bacterium]|nr:pirin family protein [Deltaproteobacteria bacterium]
MQPITTVTQEANVTQRRTLARRRRLPAPSEGFLGPGHTAIEVIRPDALHLSDPFVLLMDDRLDFPAGLQVGGAHPHAGLETVTFVIEGEMEDRDEGVLRAGDLVWMTAGRGIVHSEHVHSSGVPTRVLQLWVTLPERSRDADPRFEIVRASEVPVHRAEGVEARLYSGSTHGLLSKTLNHVPVTLLDVHLAPHARFTQSLPASHDGFLYPLAGSLRVSESDAPLGVGEIGWLDRREGGGETTLELVAGESGARVALYAGARQGEPTVQHGPFVAGSAEGIARMFHAYRAGRFTPMSSLSPSRA